MCSYAWNTSKLTNQGPFFPDVRNVCFSPFVSPDSVPVPATLLHAFRHNSQCTSGINRCKKFGLKTKQKFLYNHLPTHHSDQKTARPSSNVTTFA
jgi:hypothetical protein